ncbi:MAG: hypothetical protein ABSH19_03370 [Opitutales bacterium]|jgi:hypothetical protein
MNIPSSTRLFFFAATLLALAPSGFAVNQPAYETSPATDPVCTYKLPYSLSEPILYTLSLTFPSSAYVAYAENHSVSGQNLHLVVRYIQESGIHLPVLTTRTVYFMVYPPHLPATFTVTVNGLTLGPPASIKLK